MALELLCAKLWEQKRSKQASERANDRSSQIGNGTRGNKRRSVREKDGIVIDLVTNQKWRLKDYIKGDW